MDERRPSVDELTGLELFEAEFVADFEPEDLDELTVARLLAGLSGPAAGDDERRLAALLGAAAAPGSSAELAAGPPLAALAAVTAAAQGAPVRRRLLLRHGLAVSITAGALALSGVAAAYTGNLPATVQQFAADLGAGGGRPAPETTRPVLNAIGSRVVASVPAPVAVSAAVRPSSRPAPSSTSAPTAGAPVAQGAGTTSAAKVGPTSAKAPAKPTSPAAARPQACTNYQDALLTRDSAKQKSTKAALLRAAGGQSKVADYCGYRTTTPASGQKPNTAPPQTREQRESRNVIALPPTTATPNAVVPQPPSHDSAGVSDGSTDDSPPAVVG